MCPEKNTDIGFFFLDIFTHFYYSLNLFVLWKQGFGVGENQKDRNTISFWKDNIWQEKGKFEKNS